MSSPEEACPVVSATELVARLEALREQGPPEALREQGSPAALVFDGDGTLWSGDVGEDLFHFAVRERLLRPEASAGLSALAERFGVIGGSRAPRDADAHELAERLYAAYLDESLPERETCEMMTWCYAGMSVAELDEVVGAALPEAELDRRRLPELDAVLEWARARALRCHVVSASPRAAVRHGARLWGFEDAAIVASDPRIDAGSVAAALAHPVPYAEEKVRQAHAVLRGARWLACFGDNVFDLEMLGAAEQAVAVRPKRRLRERLGDVPGALRLLAASD